METVADPPEDPLVAALPPATDYITYLTLLEYQLTPRNLHTLNRLLLEDDGKLAEEIGWDLLKLVLPLLGQNPGEATKCLEIVARRGNPREVIVRIAETLETLGEDGNAEDFGEHDDDDGLPTFPGEAERIHLGQMKLDGMPDTKASSRADQDVAHLDDTESAHDGLTPDQLMQFEKLLNMLSILHPRIKTSYPSRFLATSLPAALRAYRRLPISVGNTSTFLSFLSKLSGKQRPALPPRASSTQVTPSQPTNQRSSTAPLPDPEANQEANAAKGISDSEREIIQRLLQAVMLEILEEYTSSLQSQENQCMSWSVRLREKLTPRRSVPGKQTETDKWRSDPSLQQRDALITRLVQLSKDLHLNVSDALQNAMGTTNSSSLESTEPVEGADSPSEYPTKPSDIPLSTTGLILLCAASQAQKVLSSSSAIPDQAPLPLLALMQHFINLNNPSASGSGPGTSLATTDALLFLISLPPPEDSPQPQISSAGTQSLLLSLLTFSATCLDPLLRDSAFIVASDGFNYYCEDRVGVSKEIMRELGTPFPSVHAVVIGWLKDAFVDKSRKSLDPDILTTDADLEALLFPLLNEDDNVAEIELRFPVYIASLNLYCVLRAQTDLKLYRAVSMVGDMERVMRIATKQGAEGVDLWALEDAMGRAKTLVDEARSTRLAI